MTDDLCGHLRLKGDAAKLRGRRIGCGFGAESLTIKGEASTFLAVRRSAFGDDAPPTLTLSDGTSEVARNVDELFRGEASVVEAALDDEREAELLLSYFGASPSPAERGRVVLYKAMCDLLWTLWGLLQHKNGNPAEDFWAYSLERFARPPCWTVFRHLGPFWARLGFPKTLPR